LGAIKRCHTQAGEAADTRISIIAQLLEPDSQSGSFVDPADCRRLAFGIGRTIWRDNHDE
jgi:hypothetical protein